MTAKKFKRIQKQHKRIIEAFEQYAFHCQEWEPRKEDDFDDLCCLILNILVNKNFTRKN